MDFQFQCNSKPSWAATPGFLLYSLLLFHRLEYDFVYSLLIFNVVISGLKLLISTVIVLCNMRASTCKNEVSHSLYEYLTSTAIWYVDQVKIFDVEKSFSFSRASCINVNCERSTFFSRGSFFSCSAYTNRSTIFIHFFFCHNIL